MERGELIDWRLMLNGSVLHLCGGRGRDWMKPKGNKSDYSSPVRSTLELALSMPTARMLSHSLNAALCVRLISQPVIRVVAVPPGVTLPLFRSRSISEPSPLILTILTKRSFSIFLFLAGRKDIIYKWILKIYFNQYNYIPFIYKNNKNTINQAFQFSSVFESPYQPRKMV